MDESQEHQGPVRVWDTERWIANSEDRFPALIASMRAQGQSRTAGIYAGNVYDSRNLEVDGAKREIVQAWAPAAAVAATQKFLGRREFSRLLFGNGLPWVFVFSGLPNKAHRATNAEDGTMIVLGDLKALYDPDRTLFRSVKLQAGAHMVLHDPQHRVRAYDSNGNEMRRVATKLTIPLNGGRYFLRGDGRPDNKGPAHELATGRSVSTTNSFTFHDDWKTHWANELEFGSEALLMAKRR